VGPIVVTIGATVLSDTLSLVVFAVCASMYTTGFSASVLAIQLAEIRCLCLASMSTCAIHASLSPNISQAGAIGVLG
jgi:hypothetical protein